MEYEPWVWAAFGVFVVLMLLVDLVAFGRRGEEVPLRRAAVWSVAWTVLGLAVAGVLWAWQGREPAGEYLAGFVIEKSLSIDSEAGRCAAWNVSTLAMARSIAATSRASSALRAAVISAGVTRKDSRRSRGTRSKRAVNRRTAASPSARTASMIERASACALPALVWGRERSCVRAVVSRRTQSWMAIALTPASSPPAARGGRSRRRASGSRVFPRRRSRGRPRVSRPCPGGLRAE